MGNFLFQIKLPSAFRENLSGEQRDSQTIESLFLVFNGDMSVLQNQSDPKIFSRNVWFLSSLFWNDQNDEPSRLKNLTNLDFDSNVFLLSKEEDKFLISEVYQITHNFPMVVQRVKTFSNVEKLNHITPIWTRRVNLRGAPIKISAQVSPPFITGGGSGVGGYGGIYADVMLAIAKDCNMTFQWFDNTDRAFGQLDEATGTW